MDDRSRDEYLRFLRVEFLASSVNFRTICQETAAAVDRFRLRVDAPYQAERCAALFEGRVPPSREVFWHGHGERRG